MSAGILNLALKAVCPIEDCRVGKIDDRTTWSYTASAGATTTQIAAANNVIATFDITAAIASTAARRQGITDDVDFSNIMTNLETMTAAQLKTYVTNQTVGLPTAARVLIGQMVFALALIARRT